MPDRVFRTAAQRELQVGRLSYRGTWMYVTDGGHLDNLGLLAALHRGADRIVVPDAAGDPADR